MFTNVLPNQFASTAGVGASLRVALLLLAALGAAGAARADMVYAVRQTFAVTSVPAGAKHVRGWFWMPEDRPDQRVLEFRVVDAPGSFRITRDPRHGRSWLYAEATASSETPLRIVTEFKVQRRKISGLADPQRTRPITDVDQRAFAAELRRDEKHMEVTPRARRSAVNSTSRRRLLSAWNTAPRGTGTPNISSRHNAWAQSWASSFSHARRFPSLNSTGFSVAVDVSRRCPAATEVGAD